MTNTKNPFSTGHTTIDNHHEELFHLVTSLDTAVHDGDEEALNTIIEFLEHYVDEHFKEEEDLMKANNYTGYDHHKAEHEKFKGLVSELREHFNNNKPLTHVIFEIRRIIDILVTHIQTVDIGIANIGK